MELEQHLAMLAVVHVTLEHVYIEAATGCVLSKKVFLEILENSQESTCARFSILIKLQAGLQLY